MTELLPCPFCGGEAHVNHDHRWYGDVYKAVDAYEVVCLNFGCIIYYADDVWYDTESEAIAAWNSRAERTCECVAEYAKSPIDGKTIVLHRCSACHELMRPHMAYCPNCGAKVVGE